MQNKFVVTIARGYGSGGKTIGRLISEKLNIGYYNRDILQKASDDSGINKALFAKADEKTKRGVLRRVFARKATADGTVIPPSSNNFVSEQNLFNYQSKIIKELAEKESCVIVGRCADYVLRDMPEVVRIYIYASPESCVKKVMQTDGIDEAEAKRRIKSIDKQRSEYYSLYTGRKWQDADNYDLCINTDNISFEKATQLICDYIKLRFE